MSTRVTTNAYEIAHEFVDIVARHISRDRFRLRKYKPDEQRDIIKRVTERACSPLSRKHQTTYQDLDGANRGLSFLGISIPPEQWPIFQRPLTDPLVADFVHHVLDLSMKTYKKQTAWSNGRGPEKPDLGALERFTDTASYMPDIQQALDVENARYQSELDAYAASQTKPKHRTAVQLLRKKLSFEEIRKLTCNENGKLGISEKILTPHHRVLVECDRRHLAVLTEIADKHLLTDVDGRPYSKEESEELTQQDTESQRLEAEGVDAGDCANNRGAPETVQGFRNYRAREPGSGSWNGPRALASGSLFPTREERVAPPKPPRLDESIIGTQARHARFGDGVVFDVSGSEMCGAVLVSFAGEPRWVALHELEILPGTAPDPKDERAQADLRERIRAARAMAKEIEQRLREDHAERRMEQAFARRGATETLAEIQAACREAGLPLGALFGEDGAPWTT